MNSFNYLGQCIYPVEYLGRSEKTSNKSEGLVELCESKMVLFLRVRSRISFEVVGVSTSS